MREANQRVRRRPGQSRYKIKRSTPITFAEFSEMIERLERPEERSLLAFLFYTGARTSEVVGDSAKRYKRLSRKGEVLKDRGYSQETGSNGQNVRDYGSELKQNRSRGSSRRT